MYVYITARNLLISIESQDNVYDVMPRIPTKKKKICFSNTFISLFANKKSLLLYAYICPCKLVLKGMKNFFLIFLELSFIGKICGGWWNVCNHCYSTWLSSSSCSALAHNWWSTFRTVWGETIGWEVAVLVWRQFNAN